MFRGGSNECFCGHCDFYNMNTKATPKVWVPSAIDLKRESKADFNGSKHVCSNCETPLNEHDFVCGDDE